jgi:hypothetical protein
MTINSKSAAEIVEIMTAEKNEELSIAKTNIVINSPAVNAASGNEITVRGNSVAITNAVVIVRDAGSILGKLF